MVTILKHINKYSLPVRLELQKRNILRFGNACRSIIFVGDRLYSTINILAFDRRVRQCQINRHRRTYHTGKRYDLETSVPFGISSLQSDQPGCQVVGFISVFCSPASLDNARAVFLKKTVQSLQRFGLQFQKIFRCPLPDPRHLYMSLHCCIIL